MNQTGPPPSDERPDPDVRVADQRAPLRIDRSVVRDVADHVGGDTTVERGGVLLGEVAHDGTITIDASIRAEHAISHASSLTFTHETWDAINVELEREHAGKQIVGWYHSHPGFSVFLSEYDTFIHRNFFSASWQVAYVVDPLMGDDGFFGWEGDEIVRYQEWDLRAVGGRGGALVSAPAPHRQPPSPEPAPSSRTPLLVAITVGAALAGLVAGLMLGSGDVRDDQPFVELASIRNDGLVVTRDLAISDGCLETTLRVINPTDFDLLTLQVVDAIPSRLHGGEACDGSSTIADRAIFSVRGGLPSGESVRDFGYSVKLPDDVDEASALDVLIPDYRSEWARLVSIDPTLEVADLRLTVGELQPIDARRRHADGSLLTLAPEAGWTIAPPDVAVIDGVGVRGLQPGLAEVLDLEGRPIGRLEVVEATTVDPPSTDTSVTAPPVTG